ncbi:DNA polymerase III subunit delta' [Sphingomonas crusticola]|uniref:DNA polymerase III subunit delta' n=1 Tax=Sphingomonas crusticola TaxID=1697973 RepID=UPI000E2844AB|nr:DNA polymerase III subunit delta' [Sphingomonas crusticola]
MIVGHEEPIAAFLDAARSDRLHHAWLLAGPEGVGKGTFARAAARWLLAAATGPDVPGDRLEVPETHTISSLINAGSHPDFKLLERLPRPNSEDLARSITVDQVRSLQPLFATTPSMSARRVVVIDAIDDMERGGANALLKNLEEPPASTIFLLVSHAPGRLLPTIRSRCRLLRFGPLTAEQVGIVLRHALPEADGSEVDSLTRVAEGSPGNALRFAGLDIASLDAAIETLAARGDSSNALRTALGRTLATKSAQPRYEAFLERAPSRIAAAARWGRPDMGDTVALWRQARDIADRAVRQSLDPQLTVVEIAGLVAKLAQADPPAKG